MPNSYQVDEISQKYFNILKKFMPNLISYIEPCHKEICSSQNNSKSINQYIENLTRAHFPRYLDQNNHKWKVYPGEHMADTSIDLGECVVHIDNKGVEVIRETKKLTIDEMNDILQSANIDTTQFNKKRRKEFEDAINENKLEGHDNDYYKYCEEFTERFKDHKDENLHFKMSQSNLNLETLTGKCKKEQVRYIGKLPKCAEKPHITFILKHVYSNNGIYKLVLYSIPHQICQDEYPDIQKEGNKKRTPKAADEFRFNMNDENGNPYKFINSDIERYKCFEY